MRFDDYISENSVKGTDMDSILSEKDLSVLSKLVERNDFDNMAVYAMCVTLLQELGETAIAEDVAKLLKERL